MPADDRAAPFCPSASRTVVYQPRRPERTVVYPVVQRHLERWLEETRGRDPDGEPVPAYIERDFRQNLTCDILAHGFAGARCAGCGHDFLVAFACREAGRLLFLYHPAHLPAGRQVVETAAHRVDQVFPQMLVRQWVLVDLYGGTPPAG